MDISKDDTNQGGDESDSDSDSWESTANPSPESAIGDCLTCLDTKDAAVRLPARSSTKRCGPLVSLLSRASGWRPSWNRFVIVARLCREQLQSHQDRAGVFTQ